MSEHDTSIAAADARHESLGGDTSVIPRGCYCYTRIPRPKNEPDGHFVPRIEPCPYWAFDKGRPEQQAGYCAHLKAGDWEEDGTLLLWDQCKECGVNDDDQDYLDQIETDAAARPATAE